MESCVTKRLEHKDPARMQRNGAANGRSILTPSQALAIYTDERPHQQIADAYGLKRSTVTSIKIGDRWGWLTCELDHKTPVASSV